MIGKLETIFLRCQLMSAERNAKAEARAMQQARANEVYFQLRANKLRKKLNATPSVVSETRIRIVSK